MDLCEFQASLVYRVSSGTARVVTQRNPISKNQKKKKKSINKQEKRHPKKQNSLKLTNN